MTQDLANKLISWYLESIKMIEKENDINTINQILDCREIGGGICFCADRVFHTWIVFDEWVESFIKYDEMYWFEIPEDKPKQEILNLLQLRVDRLKTFKTN